MFEKLIYNQVSTHIPSVPEGSTHIPSVPEVSTHIPSVPEVIP